MTAGHSFSSSGRGHPVSDDMTPAGKYPDVVRLVALGPLRALVRSDGSVTLVDGDGDALRAFTAPEWLAFWRGVRDGEFADLAAGDEALAAVLGPSADEAADRAEEEETHRRWLAADEPPAVPDPPGGFRCATSTYDVFQAPSGHRGNRYPLRAYVRGQWHPARVVAAIGEGAKRPRRVNVPMELEGERSREIAYGHIALPADDPAEPCARCEHRRDVHEAGACLAPTTADEARRGVHPSAGRLCPCAAFVPRAAR